MNIKELIEYLYDAPGLPGLFNPYRDRCAFHDLSDGPAVRRQNLQHYLQAHKDRGSRQMWIAEAASYLGSRRSGIYLLPESHLKEAELMLEAGPFLKATRTPGRNAPTAQFLWNIM